MSRRFPKEEGPGQSSFPFARRFGVSQQDSRLHMIATCRLIDGG